MNGETGTMSGYVEAMRILHEDPEVLVTTPAVQSSSQAIELICGLEDDQLANTARWAGRVLESIDPNSSENLFVFLAAQGEVDRRSGFVDGGQST